MFMLAVYTDRRCGFCRWAEARVKRFDRHGALQFLDYNDPAVRAGTPFSREELAREMHVRAEDGTWRAGFFGWLAVLRALPALAWLARLLVLPPLRWLGPPLYRLIARHRSSLPGAPPRCDNSCNRNLAAGLMLAVALAAGAARGEAQQAPASNAARLERAIELLRQEKPAEARAELEAIVKAEPGNAQAEAYLAAAELHTGDVEAAIARASRLLQADPDNIDLHELLGQAHMLNRDWAPAEKEWRAVLAARPNSEEAHFQLANALLQLGHFQEGLQEVTRAVEINPRRSDARALRGNTLASLGRMEEAANEWNLALARDANNPAALAGLAVSLRDREPEYALEYARRAVEISNWNALGPIRILALVYRARGEFHQAREVLQKAVLKFPDNPLLAAELRAVQQEERSAPQPAPKTRPAQPGKPAGREPAELPINKPPQPAPEGGRGGAPPQWGAQHDPPLNHIRVPALLPAQPYAPFVDRGLPVDEAAAPPAASPIKPPEGGSALGDVARYYRERKQAQKKAAPRQ